MPGGIEDHEETARAAASDLAARSREEIDDLRRTVEELQREFTAAAPGAAGSEAQGAGTERATGVQGGAGIAVRPQGRGTRTTGVHTPFSHTSTPKLDGKRDFWPPTYLEC